jgi:hypothetical protein
MTLIQKRPDQPGPEMLNIPAVVCNDEDAGHWNLDRLANIRAAVNRSGPATALHHAAKMAA